MPQCTTFLIVSLLGVDTQPHTLKTFTQNVKLLAFCKLCWNRSLDLLYIFTMFFFCQLEETRELSIDSHKDFIGCQTKWFFIEEGSNKLCFLLCHTIQYEGHVIKIQGFHKKAKAKNGDLRLHYPVSNSFSFFLRKCNCRSWEKGLEHGLLYLPWRES